MIKDNYFTWERIRETHRYYPETINTLQQIDDILERTKEGRAEPNEALHIIKHTLNKTTFPPRKQDIKGSFTKIEFPNHLSYDTGTDLNIPITKDNKVIGFVKDVYETRCIGYIFAKCIDIIPELLVDEKKVMSFEIIEERNKDDKYK